MNLWYLSLAILLACAWADAQQASSTGFNRPPAGVDEALRERVRQFYDLEQQGRFRQAEALVCEDSKDRYYDMEKRRWTSVELIQITYEENFTRARASLALGTEMATFAGPLAVKAPLTSLWRLENGEWCRYFPDPAKEGYRTPFGIMKPSPPSASGSGASANPLAALSQMPKSAGEVMALVKLSRTSVSLPASGGAEEVEISNGMPGGLNLRLLPPLIEGFEAALSSDVVPGHGKAVLRLSYRPKEGKTPPPQTSLKVIAEPLGAEKVIQIYFQ